MRSLSDPDFLDLWERGRRFDPLDQSLLALAAVIPETSYDDLADWPLGRRNQALARLRCACFGPALQGWTSCAQCGEKLEFEMDCRALAEDLPPREPVIVDGQAYRLPTTRDLAAVAVETDPSRAAVRLLEACRLDSSAASPGDPEEVGNQMALADPLAETRLSFECPECGGAWDEALNIAAFLWTEIESRARRLLAETHALARAYGWTEKEIFSLSAARRGLYVEMVTG